MKYHVIPSPKELTPEERQNKQLRGAFNDARGEIRTELAKLCKKEKDVHHKEYFHLYDKTGMETLMKKLKDGDEIVIHGEGQPFLIGLEEPSQYDLYPWKLAMLLSGYGMPDVKVNINLLACYSATQYQELNFAQDTSKGLSALGYEEPSVTGYTGMIKVASNAKYTVSSEITKDTKGTHASLEDASMVYQQGKIMKSGRILSDNSHIAYSWATQYIERAREGNAIAKVSTAKTAEPLATDSDISAPKAPLKRSLSLSFFPESTSKTEDGPDKAKELHRHNSMTW